MSYRLIQADAIVGLQRLHARSVRCVVTSPPYWRMRDYGVEGQYGMEGRAEDFLSRMVNVFRNVHRVLRNDGTMWINMGDGYASDATGGSIGSNSALNGSKKAHVANMLARTKARLPFGLRPKQLIGMPWRLALALQADGWYLRRDVIWHKTNPMPETIRDRPTNAHEYLFLFAKSERYFYDIDATKVACSKNSHARYARHQRQMDRVNPKAAAGDGRFEKQNPRFSAAMAGVVEKRNLRSVWSIGTQAYKGKHTATFPAKLVLPCVLASSALGDMVLDPFCGTGTVGEVAILNGRDFTGIDIAPDSIAQAEARLGPLQPPLAKEA